jgi:CRISPR-associated protein Cas2
MVEKYPALIAYDVRSDRVSYRVRKILKQWKIDGQKSVVECLLSRNQAHALFEQLSQTVDAKTDKLMLTWINPYRPIHTRGNQKTLGFFKTFFHVI